MKKIYSLIALLSLVSFLNVAEAQVKSNIIKTSLTAPLIKTYTIAYERAFNADISAQLGFNYFAGWKLGDSRIKGFSIAPEFRYYLSEEKEAPNGPFLAPFGRLGNTGVQVGEPGDENYGKASVDILGGGLLIGTQRIFKETISLEAFVGPAFYSASLNLEGGTEEYINLNLIDGWSLRLGITVGIVF